MKTKFEFDIAETASLYERLGRLKKFIATLKEEIAKTEKAIKKQEEKDKRQTDLIDQIDELTNTDTTGTDHGS